MHCENVKLIINISEKYNEVADIFVSLLNSNWKDCPFEIILSYNDGFFFKDYGYTAYVENNQNIPNSIYNISKKYPADYYICLLGDAFISKKVDNNYIVKLIDIIEKKGISYCNLLPKRKKSKLFRYIRKNEIYSINFISFIASHHFIEDEFKENISDLDFENKYLKSAFFNENNNEIWNDKIVNESNVLNIVHGINKGKWIRRSYNTLKNNEFVKRSSYEKMTQTDTFFYRIRLLSQNFLKPSYRITLKKTFSKLGMNFNSDY